MNSVKVYVGIAVICGALVGCMRSYDGQPHNYSGNNLEGLLVARQQCMAELSGTNSGGVNVNVSVNSNYSQPLLSCAAFNTCVANKGYMREPTGNISLPNSFVVSCR